MMWCWIALHGCKCSAVLCHLSAWGSWISSRCSFIKCWDCCRSSVDHLYLPTSEDGRRQLQQNAAKFAKEITKMLWRVPRPLLLLLKTNDCLRTVDSCLGQARLPSLSRVYIVYCGSPVLSCPPY